MHIEARNFTLFVKNVFPPYFFHKKVLDVGGGDINGNNRHLFQNCEIEVNDVTDTQNVTIVSKTKDLPFLPSTFDTIISTECFEHDPEYELSLLKILELLKPNGLFFFTCASTDRHEHGTRRTSPQDSYGTIAGLEDMVDYYKNLTLEDINKVISLNDHFIFWDAYYNASSKDLYFMGIKKSFVPFPLEISFYLAPFVTILGSSREQKRIDTVFNHYNSDKNAFFHNYTRQYASLLSKFELQPIRLLEIGVLNGQSLLSWREFFPNAQSIVGIDIDPNCKKFELIEQNIFVEVHDSSNPNLSSYLQSKYQYFDIILDDGSHSYKDIVSNFTNLFGLLKEDGLYICEDTICYKDTRLTPNFPEENHLNFFGQFITFLNQWRFDSYGIQDHCIDPFKIQKRTENQLEASIDKIEFGCSYVAITKKTRYHWLP